jgi:hypothetical protein
MTLESSLSSTKIRSIGPPVSGSLTPVIAPATSSGDQSGDASS